MAAVALAAPSPSPDPRKLRVGLFADAPLQPRWIVEAFDKVARSDFAEIALISVGARRPGARLLWRAYAGAPDEVDLSAIRAPGCDPDLKKHGLDVAFALGDFDDRVLDGIARYGVWRFCFGMERGHAESLAGWREFADNAPLTGSGIKARLASGAPARLAYQSWSRTDALSFPRTRGQLLQKTAEFAWRALRELHRSGPAFLDQCKIVRDADTTPGTPSARELARALTGLGSRIVGRAAQKALTVEQWSLAWRWREERFGDGRTVAPDLRGYTRAMPPLDREWLAPFAIEKNGRYFMFFAERLFAAGKAHISMIEVKRDGTSKLVRVLEREDSLSHPFLVEEGGELYMIPHSERDGAVQVYRCVDFPLRWKLEKTLLEGVRLANATFHRAADRWWMFAGALDDELQLFHARELLGAWRPHPRNPLRSDARCARPAGQLFVRGGALYRPAQICVPRDGAGLSMNRVLRLTPEEYAERQVERILPIEGLRTLNRAGDLTVVDAYTRRSRFA